MKVSGYVLAGGQSSRMGRDKALLRLGEQTLLEIALDKLKQVCSDVSILCGSQQHGEQLAAYGRVVVDRIPHSGPLGGIDAALHDAQENTVLLVAVDTPFLPVELLQELIENRGTEHEYGQGGSRGLQAPEYDTYPEGALAPATSTSNVTCFEVEGFIQPLPMRINRGTLPIVEVALTTGEFSLLPLLRRLGLQTISADDESLFANINTPEEFVTLQKNKIR